MPTEVYTLIRPLKGFNVGDKFVIVRVTEKNYVIARDNRPGSLISFPKELFAELFALDKGV